jgi:hypothetical protein
LAAVQSGYEAHKFNSKNDLQGHWKGSWVVTIAKVKATIRFALDLAKLPARIIQSRYLNLRYRPP